MLALGTTSVQVQNIRQFFREYLDERAEMLRRNAREFATFRQKFYTKRFPLGRMRSERLKRDLEENEEITAVQRHLRMAHVITTTTGGKGPGLRRRYVLARSDARWLIRKVQIECPLCDGRVGERTCQKCHGEGWWTFLRSDQAARAESTSNRKQPPPPWRSRV